MYNLYDINNEKLMNALINNKAEHPERTNATVERVYEVLDNVLGDEELIETLDAELGEFHGREPISKQQAKVIFDVLKDYDITLKNELQIIDQLMYSEISTAEAIDLHEKFKIPVSCLEDDIVPVKGFGCKMMDTLGDWYLDMDSNYSATNLGLSNSEIARGLSNQASKLISMKEDRVQIARSRFLKHIHQMMPEGLEHFYWQNSGGEAVDKALKISKAYTNTKNVIAFKNGFHGRTHGAVAVTWNKEFREPFHLHDEDWVHFADFNDAESVRRLMDETGAKIVIMEMVQGEEGGNRPAEQEFVNELWSIVRERNGIIIDDEVQTGFGRVALKEGDWFACDSFDVVPDIMVIGKSFGGGYPVTAVVTREEISEKMQGGWDGSTFGGNPMAMTAALIATRQMREKDITNNVIVRSKQFIKGMKKITGKYEFVDDVRAHGLMLAFSLGSGERVSALQENLAKHGVKSSLSTGEYIRFLPPTIISEKEMDFFLKALDNALAEVE